MKFTLYTLAPKQKLVGVGSLSIHKKEAHFFSGDAESGSRILAEMHRVEIEWAAKDGITISGVQPDGFAANGVQKYKFQQWFLSYAVGVGK